MNYYIPGMEVKDKVDLVLSLTSIRSEPMVKAIHYHLVRGFNTNTASDLCSVDESNLKRSLRVYNEVLTAVEKIKEIDWSRLYERN